mmetsp:Transcript_16945/g.25139  ORF Transcript_16945/g.25139 Transcript_16945/m.25139 type:complete len:230 (-) Transcript_16945:127-816(-)
MMLSAFNLVPTMTLFLFMAAFTPQFALAKQELSSFLLQDQDIKQALGSNPIPDKLHRYQEVEEEEKEEEDALHEIPFSVETLIIGHEDALTESQKDIMGKLFMKDYNDLSDNFQIDSITVEEVDSNRELMIEREERHLGRNSIVTRFRYLSICRRCPSVRYRDPLYDANTKRPSVGNRKKRTPLLRGLNEDDTNASVNAELAWKFMESFSIDLTNLFGEFTLVEILDID